jgi:hypothetical protein
MRDQGRTIPIGAELHAKLNALAESEGQPVSRLISDAVALFTGLSVFARIQLRSAAATQPSELPRIHRAVSATITHAVHNGCQPPAVWVPPSSPQ